MNLTNRNQTILTHQPFICTSLSHIWPAHLTHNPIPLVFLVGFLLFSLVACSTGTSPTTVGPQTTASVTNHPSPTPTHLPAGIVLYQADWSHGIVGWQGTQGWKVVQGQLESDSSGSAMFTIPYHLSVSDYKIEVRLQIVRLLSQIGGSSFTIFATKEPGRDGYQGGVSNLLGSQPHPMAAHPQCQIFLDPYTDAAPGGGLPSAFYPGSGWRTYSVEVQGNQASLFVDGLQIRSVSSDQTPVLSNGPLGLSSEQIILRVSSIRVLSL